MKRVLAAVMATAALSVAGPANAGGVHRDDRPCVTWAEFHSTLKQAEKPGRLTKDQIEQQWGVQDAGRRTSITFYGMATAYTRCGYSHNRALYGVRYREGRADYFIDWKVLGASAND